MDTLKGSQKKYLRGLAHGLNPSAFIGQKGLTETVIQEIDTALEAAELIKVKFNHFKEKQDKSAITEIICRDTRCFLAGTIGHVAILYRPAIKKEKQKIVLPG